MSSEQNISAKTMRIMAEVMGRLANGGLDEKHLAAQLQAMLEGRPMASSSLGTKVLEISDNVEITEDFLSQTMVYRGQKMRRHRNGGGWVPLEQSQDDESMPYVAASAYVGPFAIVSGNARVSGDAEVSGNARVSGDAEVSGNARVSGDAEVYGNAWVSGNAQVYGNARVYGNAQVYGDAEVYGDKVIR